MTRPSLGITAMELFACNPFRVLGIAVDTPTADVTLTYKKLLDMAAKGDTADYETPYDFDFLPPFSRSEKDLKTAYAKIASNGYRCFAFSDPIFSASLNIDDVMLNLRDISCYDCFLRCYMWLITNDRDFEEPELWIPLCQYIDKMIMSSPEQWDKYFDHRFPQDMLDGSMSALRSFYATFCDIILLPIKEMVRGSMKCRSAMEILKIAKVDVDEVFPDIDIPQANLPKRGEPAPKLKIAVKDGEEYYDVTTGKMVSFEGTRTLLSKATISLRLQAPFLLTLSLARTVLTASLYLTSLRKILSLRWFRLQLPFSLSLRQYSLHQSQSLYQSHSLLLHRRLQRTSSLLLYSTQSRWLRAVFPAR